MTGPNLIRLAEDLAQCGGIHRLTNCIAAACHVFAEHERRARACVEAWEDGPVGVGMSDKAAPAPRCTEYLREQGEGYRWPCERCGAGPCRARAGVNPAPVMSERGERQPVPCGAKP